MFTLRKIVNLIIFVSCIYLLSLFQSRTSNQRENGSDQAKATNNIGLANQELFSILKKWNDEDTSRVLRSVGEKIRKIKNGKMKSLNNCSIWTAGISRIDKSMYGAHEICDYKPKAMERCVFYSFGIGKNYLFDKEIANKWGCHGVAFDPSVIYPSKIHKNITFHMIAAKTLSVENDMRWPLRASIPGLIKVFGHNSIKILKVDCEGCEYSLAADIEEEQINLFSIVEQFSVELHLGKSWIQSKRHVSNLAKLFFLLEHAGLHLSYVRLDGLDLTEERLSCAEEFREAQYPCSRNSVLQNLLFAKLQQSEYY